MTPSAAEILERAASVYANCTSYRDTGEVVTVVFGGPLTNKPSTLRKPFSTLFVRPDMLRFESSNANEGPPSNWNRHVVWASGGRVQGWFSADPPAYKPTSVLEALGATGFLDGSAWRIPYSLLLRGEMDDPLPTPATARVLEHATPEGEDVYVVSGTTGKGQQLEMWFAVRTFLIRRARHAITSQRRFGGKGQLDAIRNHPRLSEEQRKRVLADLESRLKEAKRRSRPRVREDNDDVLC